MIIQYCSRAFMLVIISQIYVDIDLTSKYLETKLHFVSII